MFQSRAFLYLTLFAVFLMGACGGAGGAGGIIGGGGTGPGGGSGGGTGGGGTGGSGGGTGGGSGGGETLESNFLLDLHIHGSMSEGAGTMASHTNQAVKAGFDGLWWTDHMGRQLPDAHQHGIDFEGDLDGSRKYGETVSRRWMEEDPGDLQTYTSSFSTASPAQGLQSLKVALDAPSGSAWETGALRYQAANKAESISLLAEPHVGFDFRLQEKVGTVGLAVRVTLSSTYDRGMREGKPRILQFVPEGLQVPVDPDVETVMIHPPSQGDWVRFDCDLRQAAARFWTPVEDISLKQVEILLAARDGGSLSFDVDDFRIDLHGPTGAELFRIQRRTLDQYFSERLFHHVGSEMGGPFQQEITSISTRDHLLTLMPNDLEEVQEYPEGSVAALEYPRSGIDWIQARGGAAILSHIFGASTEEDDIANGVVKQLVDRLLDEKAFGADGMEVGYYHRGRPLADFLRVWDELAANGILLTGIGTSDNHNLEPWEQRLNRMATWIQSTDSSATKMCDALKGGRVFFGDPFLFDPDGSLIFRQVEGDYRMGQAVVAPNTTQELEIEIDGARSGDVLVLLKNGVEQIRWSFTDRSLAVTGMVDPEAGDWVRLEVRDAEENPFLFSNPIYYLAEGQEVPVARRP